MVPAGIMLKAGRMGIQQRGHLWALIAGGSVVSVAQSAGSLNADADNTGIVAGLRPACGVGYCRPRHDDRHHCWYRRCRRLAAPGDAAAPAPPALDAAIAAGGAEKFA